MEQVSHVKAGTYIVAVSGGIDSVVLLDVLVRRGELNLVVAHFDHGIRLESRADAAFVSKLAETYQLPFHTERLQLGKEASEATARQARYAFLEKIKTQYNALAIITAHHADDVVETMIINLLRGTGWRGLCSLRETVKIKRPFLSVRKQEVIAYAEKYRLEWREDSTNAELHYLRNRVRHTITPQIDHEAWWKLYLRQCEVMKMIDREIAHLITQKRYPFIMWPSEVALEVLRLQLALTRPQAKYALHAIKTARSGTHYQVGGYQTLQFTRDAYVVLPPSSMLK